MTETDIQCERRPHLEETSSSCEYESPYKGDCESNAEYQIWNEDKIGDVGRVEIMIACEQHTEEVKSELRQKQRC
jgi:hypothetical protein